MLGFSAKERPCSASIQSQICETTCQDIHAPEASESHAFYTQRRHGQASLAGCSTGGCCRLRCARPCSETCPMWDSCEGSLSQCSYALSEMQGSSSQCCPKNRDTGQSQGREGCSESPSPVHCVSSSLSSLPSFTPLSFPFLPLHRLPSLPGPSRNDISPTPHAQRGLCLWKTEAYA